MTSNEVGKLQRLLTKDYTLKADILSLQDCIRNLATITFSPCNVVIRAAINEGIVDEFRMKLEVEYRRILAEWEKELNELNVEDWLKREET